MTKIYVKVEPDSEEFRIEGGSIPKIFLENEAEKGRANTELINRLEEVIGERPGIVSGHRSRRKKIKVSIPENKLRSKLSEGR